MIAASTGTKSGGALVFELKTVSRCLKKLGFVNCIHSNELERCSSGTVRLGYLSPVKAINESESKMSLVNDNDENADCSSEVESVAKVDSDLVSGTSAAVVSTVGKSTNIVWQECSVKKTEREKLIGQKGCVVWITGLSGSGKSTLACTLSRELHHLGKITYILDGDNVRHGLNRDLGFKAEDRAENIRRIDSLELNVKDLFCLQFISSTGTGRGVQAFADAGIICIASLISPYTRDRDACRALLPDGDFIEVYMDVPLEICEKRDSKGLYKLARAGKIKGFTGIDDPYETPLNSEIVIRCREGDCSSPTDMAKEVVCYLENKGFLHN